MHSGRQWFCCSPFAPLRFFPPRRTPRPGLPLSPSALFASNRFYFGSSPKGPLQNKRGRSWGEAPQLVQVVTLSFCPVSPLGARGLCRVARGLGCRPSAALIGAPPCSYPQQASAAPHSLQARGRASRRWRGLRRCSARWWLRAISSAACSTTACAVRRRRALSLLRTIVGGGLPVYV